MSGDYSRQRFGPLKDHSGVFMQQGRVQLDADWNELVDIVDRRFRAETIDIIGVATVPKQTPDGFEIAISGGVPTIGRGRIYVDGLLAENHGKARPNPADPAQPRFEFDPVLAEERGGDPLPYTEQPYFPNAAVVAPFPTAGGPYLVYLDVWEREVTYLEDPDLVEIAVGVDTTTRTQTAWQVRVLSNIGTGVTCATPEGALQGWLDLISPSAGRLTTEAVGVPDDEDPCLTPPTGGFKGLENRLYRVEIHDGGPRSAATFTWSRDNATVATNVTGIPTLNTLVVARIGRDAVLRFSAGDWIEITDDWREFAGLPGIMARIQDVNDATSTITLTGNLTAGTFPTDAQGATDAARHTRIRRWDQKGKITDTNNQLLVDLDAAGSTGVIPLPASGASVILEDGVQITFSTANAGGEFHGGDYWTFAARTADASVEELVAAPPRGVHHHYCRLAIITFPNDIADCRILWPPEVADAGCDCTACVSPESHNSGVYSIQSAINEVKTDGGKICLAPGDYILKEPVRFEGARSLLLQGKGWLTNLAYMGDGPAIEVQGSTGVTIEELRLMTSQAVSFPASLFIRNSVATTIQRCVLAQVPRLRDAARDDLSGAVIGLAGATVGTIVRENLISGGIGVQNPPWDDLERTRLDGEGGLLAAVLSVQDNVMRCQRRGVSLESALFMGQSRVVDNLIAECEEGGIVVTGQVSPAVTSTRYRENWVGASHIEIRGNTLGTTGNGIVVGASDTRILDNDIGGDDEQRNRGLNGIVLVETGFDQGIERCQILGNRMKGLNGHGIAIQARVSSAMIKQNFIERVGGNGIHMEDTSAEFLSIENNHIEDIAGGTGDQDTIAAGIALAIAGDVAIVGNTVVGVGKQAVESRARAGILVSSSTSARITGNHVADIGPDAFLGQGSGIEVRGVTGSIDVRDNVVHRGRTASYDPGDGQTAGNWVALWISDVVTFVAPTHFSPSRVRFVPMRGSRDIAVLLDRRAFRLVAGQLSVAARGNVLDTFGETISVEIATSGTCTFAENRCASRARGGDSVTIVRIQANAVVASGNTIIGDPSAFGLTITAAQQDDDTRATVLGNIASPTNIYLNGNPLGDPWARLNR